MKRFAIAATIAIGVITVMVFKGGAETITNMRRA